MRIAGVTQLELSHESLGRNQMNERLEEKLVRFVMPHFML